MGRSGCRKLGSSSPEPAFLPHMAVFQSRAISSSGASPRSAARRSVSSRAKRQVRTWPSAVSRVRSQARQNGRVTEAITPTRCGPPSTVQRSAGAEPRVSSPSGVRVKRVRSEARMSPAVIMPSRFQPCWASRGICSMKRSSYPWATAQASRSGASSSLRPGIRTELTFTGVSPASWAARRPSSTSWWRSRRVRVLKTSGRRVSSETLTRSSPAALRAVAVRLRPMPLVVSDMRGRGVSAAHCSTMETRPGRSRGSPPVKRTSVMPSEVTAMRMRRTISSSESSSLLPSHCRPSSGMQ